MLLIFAAGAIVGPILASSVMKFMGEYSLYAFTALVHILLCAYTAWRLKRRVAPEEKDRVSLAEALVSAQTVSQSFDISLDDKQSPQSNVSNEAPGAKDSDTLKE